MAVTNFSTLLGLALPTTGDLSGTWGTTVNDSITALLDSAVAGTKDVFVTYPSEYAVASTNEGTAGQLLTSNGTGVAPTFQTSTAAAKGFAVGMSLVFGR